MPAAFFASCFVHPFRLAVAVALGIRASFRGAGLALLPLGFKLEGSEPVTREALMISIKAIHAAEVRVRRRSDIPECEVVRSSL